MALKVISLFSGAGGMDLGFRRAGFDIALAVEADPNCCATLRLNCPGTRVLEARVEDVPSADILREAGLAPGEAALVIGGPPCQPFSLAGRRGGLGDPRGAMLMEFVRVVRDALPAAFVMENVPGLLSWGGGAASEAVLEAMGRPILLGGWAHTYHTVLGRLNAADFGVAQSRERVFFVGNRAGGRVFEFPAPTHGDPPLPRRRTVRDAIGHLPPAGAPSEAALRTAGSIKRRIETHGY